MAKVVWTAEAERWLLRIHDYIASDKPAAAFEVVESLYRRAEILTEFPDIGHAYATPSGRKVRILLWSHYRIVFLILRRSRRVRGYWVILLALYCLMRIAEVFLSEDSVAAAILLVTGVGWLGYWLYAAAPRQLALISFWTHPAIDS